MGSSCFWKVIVSAHQSRKEKHLQTIWSSTFDSENEGKTSKTAAICPWSGHPCKNELHLRPSFPHWASSRFKSSMSEEDWSSADCLEGEPGEKSTEDPPRFIWTNQILDLCSHRLLAVAESTMNSSVGQNDLETNVRPSVWAKAQMKLGHATGQWFNHKQN